MGMKHSSFLILMNGTSITARLDIFFLSQSERYFPFLKLWQLKGALLHWG
jgi:hypothetical protein